MRKHLFTFFTVILTLLYSLLPPASLAASNNDEQKTDTQKLQSLLQELEKANKRRQQHNTQVDELSRKLECNWTLIRAYENCEKLYQDNPDEHLKCSNTAKQNAARCLGRIKE